MSEEMRAPLADDGVSLQRRLHESLKRLESSYERGSAKGAPASEDALSLDAEAQLRLALAVRGRTNPAPLLSKNLPPDTRLRVLDAVAQDSDTGGLTGLWLLSDPVRKQTLEATPPVLIAEALRHAPKDDGVAHALRVALGPVSPDFEQLPADDVRELLAVASSTEHLAPNAAQPDVLRWHLRRKVRVEEYDRIVAAGFVGRDSELVDLRDFCTAAPLSTPRVAAYFLWGSGGVGKSTLLAATLRDVCRDAAPTAPVVAHLDFDRSDLDVKGPLGLSIEVLSQASLADAAQDPTLTRICEDLREYKRRSLQLNFAAQESVERDASSLLYGSLQWMQDQRRALVLALDTFEQVESAGAAGLSSIKSWINDLAEYTHAPTIRLLVVSRSNPLETNAAEILAPHTTPTVRQLADLAPGPAVTFLTEGDRIPDATAETLVKGLGGNPLVLRLVRDLATQRGGAKSLDDIVDEVRDRGVVGELVQGVLYDRFLKHIDDKRARTYAHPGLVLPEITVELIRAVLAPINGQPDLDEASAQEIFDALASASWLVRRDGEVLRQRPDVRRLLLKLMEADAQRTEDIRRVRTAAILYHHGRREPEHRASLAYHLLMNVRSREDLTLLDNLNLRECGEFLRRHRDDLPQIAQTFITVLDFEAIRPRARSPRRVMPDITIPAEQARQHLPDDLWQAWIAGDGFGGGEGDRLVDSSDPAIALKIWHERPVGEPGHPPNFVLQALAETGDWEGQIADIDAIVTEFGLTKGTLPSPSRLSRLYWTTRLALLAKPSDFTNAELPPYAHQLVRVLHEVLLYHADQRVLKALPALCSVIDALSFGRTEIVPPRYLSMEPPDGATSRIALGRLVRGKTTREWKLPIEMLVTLQLDFAERAAPALKATMAAGGAPVRRVLKEASQAIAQLHGQPIAEVTKLAKQLQRKISLRADPKVKDPERAALTHLLRGQFTELHRPARQALVETFANANHEVLHEYAARVANHMTVLPLDLEPETFARRGMEDPAGCFHTLVQFGDRAHVLESVLTDATAFGTPPRKLALVLRTLGAWDRALTGGRSSDWWADETNEGRASRRRPTPPVRITTPAQKERAMTQPATATPPSGVTTVPGDTKQIPHMDPERLRKWLKTIEKRDPKLHAEITDKLAKRSPRVPESAPMPEGTVPAEPPRSDMTFEAIIREGRPALLIQNGRITPIDPATDEQSREMITRLLEAAPRLEPVVPLVGRIDVSNFVSPIDFVGTGWLVDTDIVVTNRHVAELIARSDGGRYTFRPGRFGDPIRVRVDYRREFGNPVADVVDVERVVWIEPNPRKADIAFLKVKSRPNAGAHPNAIALADSDAAPGANVAVLGYPARAPAHIIPDQAWMDRIYGGEYNVKRVAPGLMDDPSRGWATHDCTTLGGNSGSVVIDMNTARAVGLHFAGAYMIENYAVPASVIKQYLRERPWEGTRGSGSTVVRRESEPARTGTAKQTEVRQSPATAPGGGISFTIPLTLTFSIGEAVAGVAARSTGAPPAAHPNVEPMSAAHALFDEQRGAGVLAVRPGFQIRGGRLTRTQCLVVAAHPELIDEVRSRVPSSYAGYSVEVRPASIDEQLQATTFIPEAVTSVQYDDDNRTGPGFSFNWVDEQMKALLHVGPERSWSALSAFLSGATQELVSSIYEFHAAHVAEAIEKELDEGATLTLVMGHQTRDPSSGEIAEGDFERSETFGRWENEFGARFQRVVVPKGASGLVASAYHIKVTVRDGNTFWLSSGNWKRSSQPVLQDPDLNDPRRATQAGNREWHAVIENATLAQRFRNHIHADLKRSRELGGTPEAVDEEVMVDVPIAALESMQLEAPAARILEPLEIERRVRVKPLLTPDRAGAVYSKAVLTLIRSATSSLLLQIPYINIKPATRGFLAELVDALIEKSRDVADFRVIMSSSGSGFWDNIEELQRRGLDIASVRRMPKTHTKGMIVDGAKVLVGSHNWSSEGVTLNRDASLIFDDREIAQYFTQAFDLDWDRANELQFDESTVAEAPRLAAGVAPPPGFVRLTLSDYLEG